MTRDEYLRIVWGLSDSFDESVTGKDVVRTLRQIADQIEDEGLEDA